MARRSLTDAELEDMLAESDDTIESCLSSEFEDMESSDSDYVPIQSGLDSDADSDFDSDANSSDDEIRASDMETESESEWEEVDANSDQPPVHNFQFLETPGPRHAPPADANPIEYANLFFTATLLNLIVTETNRYAQEYHHAHQHFSSLAARASAWKDTSVNEIKGFLSVLINMIIIKQPTVASYCSTSPSQNILWFPCMFSRNRF